MDYLESRSFYLYMFNMATKPDANDMDKVHTLEKIKTFSTDCSAVKLHCRYKRGRETRTAGDLLAITGHQVYVPIRSRYTRIESRMRNKSINHAAFNLVLQFFV